MKHLFVCPDIETYCIHRYREVSGSERKICANFSCTNGNLVGVAVKINLSDNKKWIAPLCQKCASSLKYVLLDANTPIVPIEQFVDRKKTNK